MRSSRFVTESGLENPLFPIFFSPFGLKISKLKGAFRFWGRFPAFSLLVFVVLRLSRPPGLAAGCFSSRSLPRCRHRGARRWPPQTCGFFFLTNLNLPCSKTPILAQTCAFKSVFGSPSPAGRGRAAPPPHTSPHRGACPSRPRPCRVLFVCSALLFLAPTQISEVKKGLLCWWKHTESCQPLPRPVLV